MSKHSQETRDKISSKLKGIKRSDTTKKKMSESKRTKISELNKKNIIKDYRDNHLTLQECGKKYNLNKEQVARVLKENNIHIRNQSESQKLYISETLKKKIINDYNSGYTINECSKRNNLKRSSTYKIIKENCSIRHNDYYFKGKSRTEEVKKKISKKNKGHRVSDYTRERMRKFNSSQTKEQLKIRTSKAFLTMKRNNSFRKSQPEEDLYEYLLKENVNKTIYRQYKDKKRYPYYCDFYIVEDDLFIELNAH